ncbi:MAG: hypothetical protein ACTS4X_00880 [Candidatus Hodgkinia cicadicola]
MKCIRSSVYAIKVNSVLYFPKTLNEVKWITAASMEMAEQLAKIYTKRTLLTPRILMAEGSPSKVANRFDFNGTTKFASYFKWWVKGR